MITELNDSEDVKKICSCDRDLWRAVCVMIKMNSFSCKCNECYPKVQLCTLILDRIEGVECSHRLTMSWDKFVDKWTQSLFSRCFPSMSLGDCCGVVTDLSTLVVNSISFVVAVVIAAVVGNLVLRHRHKTWLKGVAAFWSRVVPCDECRELGFILRRNNTSIRFAWIDAKVRSFESSGKWRSWPDLGGEEIMLTHITA